MCMEQKTSLATRVATVWKLNQIILLVIAVLVTTAVHSGQDFFVRKNVTYYVSPDGDDRADGTKQHPWRSPGSASRKLKPGDTLILLSGRYVVRHFDEDIIMPPSGKPGQWITIKGEKPTRKPVIAGG